MYKDQGEEMMARNEHKLVECCDANKNSPLSEAAAGGDPDTIRLENLLNNRYYTASTCICNHTYHLTS